MREFNSLLTDQDSLFRSLGNSLKKRSDPTGFDLTRSPGSASKNAKFPVFFPPRWMANAMSNGRRAGLIAVNGCVTLVEGRAELLHRLPLVQAPPLEDYLKDEALRMPSSLWN